MGADRVGRTLALAAVDFAVQCLRREHSLNSNQIMRGRVGDVFFKWTIIVFFTCNSIFTMLFRESAAINAIHCSSVCQSFQNFNHSVFLDFNALRPRGCSVPNAVLV